MSNSVTLDNETFRLIRMINSRRAARWHNPNTTQPWNGADWSNAFAGEAGEVCNVVKKLRRFETAIPSKNQPASFSVALDMLQKEIGDAFLYMDLLCRFYNLSLLSCIILAFNEVSRREGFPERMDSVQKDPIAPNDFAARMQLLDNELNAVEEAAKQGQRFRMTSPVDDDFPQVQFEYSQALRTLFDAAKANGRTMP